MAFTLPANDSFCRLRKKFFFAQVKGGPRISGKGFHMYEGMGVRFADFI